MVHLQYVCPTRMENKRLATETKFCTNCELSVLSTVNTPASFINVDKPMAKAGKARVATMPPKMEGMETRKKV